MSLSPLLAKKHPLMEELLMPSYDLPLLQEKYALLQHEVELLKRTVEYLKTELEIIQRGTA